MDSGAHEKGGQPESHWTWNADLRSLFPYAHDCASFMASFHKLTFQELASKTIPRGKPVRDADLIEIPVACLRWTHDYINSKLQFSNGKQIFYLFDQMLRGVKSPRDIEEPLDVTVDLRDGDLKLYSTTNRRLLSLLMLQSAQRHVTVWAPCVIRPRDGKYVRSLSTKNKGLGIEPFSGQSCHKGFPLWDPAQTARQQIAKLAGRDASDIEARSFSRRVKLRESVRSRSRRSLTLEPKPIRARCASRAPSLVRTRLWKGSKRRRSMSPASNCREPGHIVPGMRGVSHRHDPNQSPQDPYFNP